MLRIQKGRVEGLAEKLGYTTLNKLCDAIEDIYPGFAWTTLSRAINGKTSPTLITLEAIARSLNTTVAYLIGETENPAPNLAADEPAPEVLTWSAQLRALTSEQRAIAVTAIETILQLATGPAQPAGSPGAKRTTPAGAQ